MNSSSDSQWLLRVLDDQGVSVDIHLDQVPKCFGRGDERVDIRLLSGQVSRRHAEIWVAADGQLMLRDLKSTNGTVVNGERMAGVRAIHHGDEIQIARWGFQVHGKQAAKRVSVPVPAVSHAHEASDASGATLSSVDSMLAIDAILDSRGNLRNELSQAEVAQAQSLVMPAVQKSAQKSDSVCGQTFMAAKALSSLDVAAEIRAAMPRTAPKPAPQVQAVPQVASQPAPQAEAKPAPKPVEAKVVPAAPKAEIKEVKAQHAEPQRVAPAVQAKPQVAAKPLPAIPEAALHLAAADAAAIATSAGMAISSVGDFLDSHAGSLLFGGSHPGLPALEDSCSGTIVHNPGSRASDLHAVGEGRAPGVSAADLCAVQAFADRQLVVPNALKRRRLLCEFVVGPVFTRNLAAIVAVHGGKIETVCGPATSLPQAALHIEKALVRKAAEEKRAVIAWDAHFAFGTSAVAVCCPLSGGEFLYSMTTFENATPAWMALLAQTAFLDRLIRKSWAAIEKVQRPAALPMVAAA